MRKKEGKRLGKFILEVGRKLKGNGSQRWEFRRKEGNDNLVKIFRGILNGRGTEKRNL